jgi:hypothetical protein
LVAPYGGWIAIPLSPIGSCSTGSAVSYASARCNDNTTCSQASACSTVADGFATARRYLKITATINEQITIERQSVNVQTRDG